MSPFSSAVALSQPELVPAGAVSRAHAEVGPISGFLVVDVRGRVAGRVDRTIQAFPGEESGPLPIRFGFLRVRRCLLPPESIEQIDGRTKVIGLRIDRKTLRARRV
jgi:hypothetical protein